jgi:hypothetical protein
MSEATLDIFPKILEVEVVSVIVPTTFDIASTSTATSPEIPTQSLVVDV